VPADDYVAEN